MTEICIFIELHYAIEKPDLVFLFNDNFVDVQETTVEHENFIHKIICKFKAKCEQSNSLKIELKNKRDCLVTDDCDHWVDVKNITVDEIDADWLLQLYSKFVHKMPQQWLDQMKVNGVEILPEYVPGTEIRLNGVFEYKFMSPFWIHKTQQLQLLK